MENFNLMFQNSVNELINVFDNASAKIAEEREKIAEQISSVYVQVGENVKASRALSRAMQAISDKFADKAVDAATEADESESLMMSIEDFTEDAGIELPEVKRCAYCDRLIDEDSEELAYDENGNVFCNDKCENRYFVNNEGEYIDDEYPDDVDDYVDEDEDDDVDDDDDWADEYDDEDLFEDEDEDEEIE